MDTQTAVLVSTATVWISAPDAETSILLVFWICTAGFGFFARGQVFTKAPLTKISQLRVKTAAEATADAPSGPTGVHRGGSNNNNNNKNNALKGVQQQQQQERQSYYQQHQDWQSYDPTVSTTTSGLARLLPTTTTTMKNSQQIFLQPKYGQQRVAKRQSDNKRMDIEELNVESVLNIHQSPRNLGK